MRCENSINGIDADLAELRAQRQQLDAVIQKLENLRDHLADLEPAAEPARQRPQRALPAPSSIPPGETVPRIRAALREMPMTVTDLAVKIGVPRSKVYPLVRRMIMDGDLDREGMYVKIADPPAEADLVSPEDEHRYEGPARGTLPEPASCETCDDYGRPNCEEHRDLRTEEGAPAAVPSDPADEGPVDGTKEPPPQ